MREHSDDLGRTRRAYPGEPVAGPRPLVGDCSHTVRPRLARTLGSARAASRVLGTAPYNGPSRYGDGGPNSRPTGADACLKSPLGGGSGPGEEGEVYGKAMAGDTVYYVVALGYFGRTILNTVSAFYGGNRGSAGTESSSTVC